jgi:peptidoglycan/xylan/chitin deacetylase (PgdA/CDA1 family)
VIQRVRLDDTLWCSSGMAGQEHRKFVKYVKWCQDAQVECHPNVIVTELEKFPETIDYLREELAEERISLDLHGWTHGPYQDLSVAEVSEHLEKSLDWFSETFDWIPLRWVTPHGSDSPEMREAAATHGLPIETCDDPVIDQKTANGILFRTRSLDFLEGKIVCAHWWERGVALYHITQAIKHGGVEPAIEASDLDPKSFKIIWGDWK